jgi:hypothetical protein
MFSVDDALVKSTPVGRKIEQPPTSFREPVPSFNRQLATRVWESLAY